MRTCYLHARQGLYIDEFMSVWAIVWSDSDRGSMFHDHNARTDGKSLVSDFVLVTTVDIVSFPTKTLENPIRHCDVFTRALENYV